MLKLNRNAILVSSDVEEFQHVKFKGEITEIGLSWLSLKDVANAATRKNGKNWHKYISGISILNANYVAVYYLVDHAVGCPWLLQGFTEAIPSL